MARLPPVYCPQCQKKYRLPKSFQNRQVVCKRCQHQFLVRAGSDDPAASADGDVSSPFDSLDVEELLNAPTSGLEKAKPSPKRVPKVKRRQGTAANAGASNASAPHSAASKAAQPTKAEPGSRPAAQDQQTAPRSAEEASNPDPGLVEEELEFAWAKKKRREEKEADKRALVTKADRSRSKSADLGQDVELDEEELAIYRAVTRQNRRWNLFWAAMATIVVVSISGFFAQQEYELLAKPLSQAERDWLTERGFVLEASHIAKAKGGDGDGAAVMVAAGKSFADVDHFGLTASDIQNEGDPANAVVGRPPATNALTAARRDAGARKRRNLPKVKPLPEVDFDTGASNLATAAIKAAQRISFSGYTVATFSPRGHAYVAGDNFIKGVSVEGKVFDQHSLAPSQTVTAIAASPDGRYVIAGDDRGLVQAYRVDDRGRLSQSWKLRQVHRDKISQLRISDDSKRLVVYSADGRLSIWDLQNQQIERSLSDLVPGERLSSFQLTKAAVLIGSGTGLRTIQLGEPVVDVDAFDQRYLLVAVDRSGENVVVSDGRQLSAIDAGGKRPMWAKTIRIAEYAQVEFSPDGETAFYYDGGRDVLHFEVQSGRLLRRYSDNRLPFVRRVAVSFDGKRLLAFGDSGSVLVYHIKDVNPVTMPELKATLAAPERDYPPDFTPVDGGVVTVASANVTGGKVSAACLNDSGFLIAAEKGRTVVYDWTAGRIAYERFDSGEDRVTTMITVGHELLLGRASGLVQVAEIESDGKLGRFKEIAGHIDSVKFFAVIPETSLVASVTQSGHTRVWDLSEIETNRSLYVGNPIESPVASVAVDRRSDLLLAAGDVLVRLDYKTGVAKQKKGDVRVRNVTILPDGKRLAFFDRSKLNFATTSRGEINLSVDLPPGAANVSFSPNSKLAFLFADENVIVYRLRGGKAIFKFPLGARSDKETTMLFSADKRFMMPFGRGDKGNFRIYAIPSP